MDKGFLETLGLKTHNAGTSTGLKSSDSGNYIASYSPVDGSLIGHVSTTTKEEYSTLIQKTSNKT